MPRIADALEKLAAKKEEPKPVDPWEIASQIRSAASVALYTLVDIHNGTAEESDEEIIKAITLLRKAGL
jgi:hypothetical protein